jgi:hypothetical protein
MQLNKNEKGSALITVVLIIAILSLLGAVLLAMTTVNLKMQAMDRSVKNTLYYTESGMEQVYALISLKVDEAYQEASEKTYDMLSHIGDDPEYLLEDQQTLDLLKVQEKANITFLESFKTYFNHMGLVEWKAYLENDEDTDNPNYYKINENQVDKPYVKIPQDGIVRQFSPMSTTYSFPIKVTFTDTNKNMSRTIGSDIVIKEPEFNFPLYLEESTIKDHPIFLTPLVSSENINVLANTVVNQGGIYAYGKKGDVYDSLTNGGIIANGANLTVNNGHLITNAYLQTRGNKGSINVYNDVKRDIYADSIVLQKDSINGSIFFDNVSVYVRDDLELNGPKSQVYIRGDYYGFSDGSTSSTHDGSSSILINANDLGINGGSKLEIVEGDVLIGGTAYIRLEESGLDIAYQTGESIAVRGNYIAYTFDSYTEEVALVPYGNLALHLIEKDSGDKLSVFELKEHFYNFYQDVSVTDPEIMSLKGINIHKDRFLYTTGAKICTVGGHPVVNINNTRMTLPLAREFMNYATEDYKKAVQVIDLNIPQGDFEGTPYEFYINDFQSDSSKQEQCRNASSFYTIDEKIYEDGTLNVQPTAYLFFYNPTDKPIHITSGSHYWIQENDSSITISYQDEKLQGLIVSEGEVNVYGTLTFEGSIISNSDINLLGNGLKTFNQNKRAIGRALEQSPYARRYLFKNHYIDLFPSNTSKHYFRISDAISYVEDPTSSTNLKFLYNQVIDFQYWTIE